MDGVGEFQRILFLHPIDIVLSTDYPNIISEKSCSLLYTLGLHESTVATIDPDGSADGVRTPFLYTHGLL